MSYAFWSRRRLSASRAVSSKWVGRHRRSKNATGSPRGTLRRQLAKRLVVLWRCHGLAPWYLTQAASKEVGSAMEMPRARPVECHVEAPDQFGQRESSPGQARGILLFSTAVVNSSERESSPGQARGILLFSTAVVNSSERESSPGQARGILLFSTAVVNSSERESSPGQARGIFLFSTAVVIAANVKTTVQARGI